MDETSASPPPSGPGGDASTDDSGAGARGAAPDSDSGTGPASGAGPDSGAAALVMLGTQPAVRFERVLAEEPASVWRALTDPEGLRGWFPCSISAQRWQVGGALTFEFPGQAQFTMEGVVLECDPPRVLGYLWGAETLRFELAPVPGGTRLVMVDELPAPLAARNAAGWHVCLDRLAGRQSAEGSWGWRRLFERYSAVFGPALGPQEGPPAGAQEPA